MKVKIFTNYDEELICSDINKWIKWEGATVVDMKYSTIADSDGQCFYTVLVMYKDL